MLLPVCVGLPVESDAEPVGDVPGEPDPVDVAWPEQGVVGLAATQEQRAETDCST